MDSISQNDIKPEDSYKIYFPDKVFGKATKNRRQDPNMFELLTWDIDGFEKHSFKKNQKFIEPSEAYMNMIGKNPWKSQAQENYLNYHQHCIEANPDAFQKIENYIDERQPQANRKQNKQSQSPQKVPRNKERRVQQQQKKQNKGHISTSNTKAHSNKLISPDTVSPKNIRKNSITEQARQAKKVKIQGPKYDRPDQPKEYQNTSYYGQNLQKSKCQDAQLSKSDQTKLIEKFKQTTRWIPNSAFTTYFGKPPFENYGRGNTHPIDGGLVYGTYLYSHNVHPHRGKNHPKNLQSYPVALMKAKSQGTLIPSYPRTKPDYSTELNGSNVRETDHKSKIQPQSNHFTGLDIQVPHLDEMQKFGGKKKLKAQTELIQN